MTESTQSLQNLLGMLGDSAAGDHAVLQKLENIQQQTLAAFASLDLLHAKVDSLCEGMQLIRSELEVADAQPACQMPPPADFVAITVRDDAALASCATTPVAPVESTATATTLTALTTLTTLATPVVPVPHEPDSDYKKQTDILNVLWPGLPKNDNESCVDRIRQEAELIRGVD